MYGMKYRVLGRTGFKVSELGLGGHEYTRFLNPVHFPQKRKIEEKVAYEELVKTQNHRNNLIKKAIDAGINYFDTGLIEETQSLGLALKTLGKRKEVYIAAEPLWPIRKLEKIPRSGWNDSVEKWINERLETLQTNYIDIFNIHMPEDNYSRKRFEFMIDALRENKDREKIRAVGAASHKIRFLAELIRKYDCFDSIMIPYNYHLQGAKEILFPLCKALNIGIVVMKPFCWPFYGISFTNFSPDNVRSDVYTPSQTSLKWILASTEVDTIVPGTNSINELEENLDTFTKEGKFDDEVLKKCLETAFNPEGKKRLRKLMEDVETIRTRSYIKGYAERALRQGGGIY
jgi:aryl-alcohol dehydrogenase-like predicted oxidoreductase